MAKKFNCVVVDRDATPELAKKFSVNSYPGMLILSPKEENIFRWSGYAETEWYMRQMKTALARFDLYKAGKVWDALEPRPAAISNAGTSKVLNAPIDERLNGLCLARGTLWCVSKDKLYELDPSTGKILRAHAIESKESYSYVDIASDGKIVYLLPYGWTMGQAILRYNLDKDTWETPIETAANKVNKVYSARGIAAREGALFVSSHFGIQKVDPRTGEAGKPVTPSLKDYKVIGVVGLDIDGKDLVAGGIIEKIKLDASGKPLGDYSYGLDPERPRLNVILRIDPDTGAVTSFEPINYPVNTIGCADGVFWLSEQPEMGFDRRNQPVRLRPDKMVIHRLVLKR